MDNVESISNMRKDLFTKKMKSSSQRVNATPNHGIVKERKNKFVKPPQSISPLDKRNIRISKLPSVSNDYYINFLNSLKKDGVNVDNEVNSNKGGNMTTFFKKKCNSYSKEDHNNNNHKLTKLKLSTNSNVNNYGSGTDADSQSNPNYKGKKKNGQVQKKKIKGEMTTVSHGLDKNKINQVVCYISSNVVNNNGNNNDVGDGGKDNVKIKIKNKKKLFGCLALCSPSA